MNRLALCAAALCLSACGEPDCSETDVSGNYFVEWDRTDGDCQTPPDGLVFIDDTSATEGCVTEHESSSEGECKKDLVFVCDDTVNNKRIRFTATIETSEDGSELNATMSATTTYLSSGQHVCSATYDVKYERQ